MLFFYLGTFAPGFVAIWLTARHDGRAGIQQLLRRLVQWRAGLRWYALALTYFAAIKLATALIYRIATGEWPRFGDEPWYLMIPVTIGSTMCRLFSGANERRARQSRRCDWDDLDWGDCGLGLPPDRPLMHGACFDRQKGGMVGNDPLLHRLLRVAG
jgi:hypothetical protein